MTPSELQHLRSLCRGFPGRFFFDHEAGDLVFVAKKCDDRECDCERKVNADGDQDCSVCIGDMDHGEDTGVPIAGMLNAVPALIEEVERLRTQLGHEREHSKMLSDSNSALFIEKARVEDFCAKVRGQYTEAHAQVTRLTSALVEAERERDEARAMVGAELMGLENQKREAVRRWQKTCALLGECLAFIRDAYDGTSPVGLRAVEIQTEAGL